MVTLETFGLRARMVTVRGVRVAMMEIDMMAEMLGRLALFMLAIRTDARPRILEGDEYKHQEKQELPHRAAIVYVTLATVPLSRAAALRCSDNIG